MKCTEARLRWHVRLDNGAKDAELDRHLGDCEACRTYAARMDRLVGLMDELREDTDALVPSCSPVIDGGALRVQDERAPTIARSLLRIAAVITVAIGAGLWYRAEQSPLVVEQNPSTTLPTTGITLREESRHRFIAVASPSAEPNVQIYWLYPSVAVTESQDRS